MVCATNAALLETPTKSAPQRQDNTTALCIFITQTPQPSIQVPELSGAHKSTLKCWVPLCLRFVCYLRSFEVPFARPLQAGRVAFAKDQRKSRGNVGREPAARLASC